MQTFREACRENTGAHFLDSGGAYGRHHEQPEIAKDSPLFSWSRSDIESECGPTINTGAFLDQWSNGGPDRELQDRFEAWAGECTCDGENKYCQHDLGCRTRLDWFAAGDTFCREVLGLECAARDNTYNGENNLSQMYVWEVWNDGESGDWIHPDDSTVSVFFIHTGCDVRGGYGRPMFVRPNDLGGMGEYSVPMDICCGFYPVRARKIGSKADREVWDVPGVDEFSAGYTRNPGYHLFSESERVFPWTFDGESAVFKIGEYLVRFSPDVQLDR